MPIIKLQNARDLKELAQRVFGLAPGDARLAEATKDLAAANPGLPPDLSKLPPSTPINVPPNAGGATPVAGAASARPQDVSLVDLAKLVGEFGKQVVATAASGPAPADDPRVAVLQRFADSLAKATPPALQAVDPKKLETQFELLAKDVATFAQRYGG